MLNSAQEKWGKIHSTKYFANKHFPSSPEMGCDLILFGLHEKWTSVVNPELS